MQQPKGWTFYWKLFSSTFFLSAFTFGGGYVIIPLMRKKFVDELHWIGEQEMIDITAIAQSSPGAIAVNASILIGYRLSGFVGAMVTILGTVLPPLIILSIVSVFYTLLQGNPIVNNLLRGMQAGVAAVIVDVVINMGRTVLAGKNLFGLLVLLAAFVATFFLKINVALIILTCGLLGYGNIRYRAYRAKKEAK
jgi:chromate transporter